MLPSLSQHEGGSAFPSPQLARIKPKRFKSAEPLTIKKLPTTEDKSGSRKRRKLCGCIGTKADPLCSYCSSPVAVRDQLERKRHMHNMREQRRIRKISQAIDDLRTKIVGAGCDVKKEKYDILLRTHEYIETLEQRVTYLEGQRNDDFSASVWQNKALASENSEIISDVIQCETPLTEEKRFVMEPNISTDPVVSVFQLPPPTVIMDIEGEEGPTPSSAAEHEECVFLQSPEAEKEAGRVKKNDNKEASEGEKPAPTGIEGSSRAPLGKTCGSDNVSGEIAVDPPLPSSCSSSSGEVPLLHIMDESIFRNLFYRTDVPMAICSLDGFFLDSNISFMRTFDIKPNCSLLGESLYTICLNKADVRLLTYSIQGLGFSKATDTVCTLNWTLNSKVYTVRLTVSILRNAFNVANCLSVTAQIV